MAVIKHIEYKIICDNCSYDVTEWHHAKTKAIAVKELEQKHGKKFKPEKTFCEECEKELSSN